MNKPPFKKFRIARFIYNQITEELFLSLPPLSAYEMNWINIGKASKGQFYSIILMKEITAEWSSQEMICLRATYNSPGSLLFERIKYLKEKVHTNKKT